jgi:hypothetical protein
MLRRLQTFLLLGVWVLAKPAAGQPPPEGSETESPSEDLQSGQDDTGPGAPDEPTADEPTADEPTADEPTADEPTADEPTADEPTADDSQSVQAGFGLTGRAEPGALTTEGPIGEPAAEGERSASAADTKSVEAFDGWETFLSGYFRAPMAIGLSPRPGPDDPDGPSHLQMSYGPNRTIDANYYSFAYTRLQEQDWAEIFIHAKKKHAEAVVGWMGYWFQAASFRNYDAGWVPGMAYLTLDTDFEAFGVKPNIALTTGAWWPKFGTFDKYDTYTLGRFRQVGEQLKLTVPVSDDLTATLVHGFGTGRDGSFNLLAPPPYQAQVGLDLIHYAHLHLAYEKYVELGLHYNRQWTRDPNLFRTTVPGKAFTDAREAYLTTLGAELVLSAPVAGSLWLSPSYIQVRNGWALAEAGTEVMHSLTADGIATNYLGWSGSLSDSTGSGSMLNVGFLYENTLSGVMGRPRGSVTPEVTLNVFGLFADISLDLPVGSVLSQDRMGQFKYGADLEVQTMDWLSFMLRWDEVNYNLNHPGYIFSAITPRVTFFSHIFSGESIHVQYSRYRYGDAMLLAGRWPWGTPLVAGSDIIQGGPYAGQKPDMDVVKVQANVSF